MNVLYADSSAALKRATTEPESAAVRHLLGHRRDGDVVVASSLAWLEVWRALRQLGLRDVRAGARLAMSGIDEFPLDHAVLGAARGIGDDRLRSLDAIHLASAVMVGAHAMITFDSRLSQAARSVGIDVVEL